MKVKDIVDIMEKHYPLSLQEEWDKCGLQVGDPLHDVHKIMISLNADRDTLLEAIENQCDMLITHHPFLLDPIENLSRDNMMGEFVFKAIKHNVAVYSSHTALDNVSMNEWLIRALDVENVIVGHDGITRSATLKQPMNQEDFIQYVKKTYQLDHFKYAGKVDMIKTIAICGGSGADFMSDYYGKADAYLTGDSKYRHAKNAVDHDILLVDINHHVENIMVSQLKEVLEKEVDIEIVEGSSPDYYHYI